MSSNSPIDNNYGKKGYCMMYFAIFFILLVLTIVMVSNRNGSFL
jgi:hypothetical protein